MGRREGGFGDIGPEPEVRWVPGTLVLATLKGDEGLQLPCALGASHTHPACSPAPTDATLCTSGRSGVHTDAAGGCHLLSLTLGEVI